MTTRFGLLEFAPLFVNLVLSAIKKDLSGSQAVMSVFRRSVVDEIHKIIRSLDDCLLDITSGAEQEEEKPQD